MKREEMVKHCLYKRQIMKERQVYEKQKFTNEFYFSPRIQEVHTSLLFLLKMFGYVHYVLSLKTSVILI